MADKEQEKVILRKERERNKEERDMKIKRGERERGRKGRDEGEKERGNVKLFVFTQFPKMRFIFHFSSEILYSDRPSYNSWSHNTKNFDVCLKKVNV